MGDPFSVASFVRVFRPPVDAWLERHRQFDLEDDTPFARFAPPKGNRRSDTVYLSAFKYADDALKQIFLGKCIHLVDLKAKLAMNDLFLDEALGPEGLRRNADKQESTIAVPRSHKRDVANTIGKMGTKVKEHVRYLGPLIDARQNFAAELSNRIEEMK
eukprot:7204414-Pyramimonas_sp.AAC.1